MLAGFACSAWALAASQSSPSAKRPFLSIMRTALRTKALFASEQDTATAKAIVIKNNLLSILYQLYSKINNKMVPGIG